ncbi:hypothetical protein FRX31_006375 [Thalictrum thalictroides]|uniref:Uncharacterized protein n=1 Tax=Thalictrum thalictroides TaxID=46969 RepID=A0A7J6X2P7_THATH|nr:hypothetical protein FRX31_006375 [Thalictrum thalictroides]
MDGKILCECSVELLKSKRYQDQWVSILGAIKQNNNEPYVEFAFYMKNESKKYRIICFPAGEDNEGWVDGGLMLLALFNSGIRLAGVQSLNFKTLVHKPGSHFEEREWPNLKHTNKPTPVQKMGEDTSLNLQKFIVESRNGLLNYSWWKSAMICKPSVRLNSWRPILAKIIEVFRETSITGLETGEAIVFLQSQEVALQLANMKPLTFNGTEIEFKRWTPEFNSVDPAVINPEFV